MESGVDGSRPRPRLSGVLLVTTAAMGTLVLGFAGLGLSLLGGPFGDDPNVTSGAYVFLFVAAGLVVLAVMTLRGSFGAWLTTAIVATLIVLLPAAIWVSEFVEELGAPEFGTTETASAVAYGPPSPAIAIGEVSSYLVFAGAAWAAVMLFLPATREALARNR